MNRLQYFNYIENKLITLATRINERGKINFLDLHLHSENFYRDFLNLLFEWNLDNLNKFKHNVAAIDLLDKTNKLIVQVSATNSKSKIESSFKKEIMKKYSGYTFKFISISKDAADLRKDTYNVPAGITFNPTNDIYDNLSILKQIQNLVIDKQKIVYEFIKKELGDDVDILKLDSNLSKVVDLLSKEDFNVSVDNINVNNFDIERKIEFNELEHTKSVINDYTLHYTRLDNIYTAFDKQGANKSYSVHNNIRNIYVELCSKSDKMSSDNIFLEIISIVKDKIIYSANFAQIPDDELRLCVDIIVVDAFIRCKIFKNPNDYKHVTT